MLREGMAEVCVPSVMLVDFFCNNLGRFGYFYLAWKWKI